ncbi:DUF58 domain-containing protein [Bifidobacterium sp. 82T24]|uniref:transglutaminaseTgpA domain-containing protein n=1 Tax=Bifidobacterium pluvialisilvae TaxID=2834436 RepID=UPI001C567CA5|nr:transglutaminaseTgpA domain-containing protein [Bifidobacterium pluvialisilvae]MBW3088771.1 DUF58 domain-containing protein [Bifidobacterium pluvialisilvae]
MLRPTARCVVVAALAATAAVLGLAVDSTALMAMAIAGLTTTMLSLPLAVIQRRLMASTISGHGLADARRRYRRRCGEGRPAADRRGMRTQWRTWLLPRHAAIVGQWTRLDQYDRPIRRFVGERPRSRGLYRLDSVAASWVGAFGLWRVRVVADDGGELCNLADPESAAIHDATAKSTTTGRAERMDTAGVRAYEAGDPWRMIAWRQTAHRGELMTRDGGRDMPADTLIVVDTWADDPAGDAFDACLAAAMRRCEATWAAGGRATVTDGVHIAEDAHAIRRFLAAAQPGDHAPGRNGNIEDFADAPTRAVSVAERLAAMGPRAVALVLTPDSAVRSGPSTPAVDDGDNSGDSDFTTALRGLLPEGRSTVRRIRGKGAAGEETPGRSAPARTEPAAARPATSGEGTAYYPIAATVIAALAMPTALAIGVWQTTALFSAGWWSGFAAVAFAAIGVESAIPARRAAVRAMRCAVVSLVVLLAGAATAGVRVHRGLVSSAAAAPSTPYPATPGGFLDAARTMIVDGAISIYEQYVPVTITDDADVLLLLVVAGTVVVLRCLLAVRSLWPFCALLPLVVMAVGYAWLGQEPDLWLVVACTGLAVILLWAAHGRRLPAPVPFVATVVVMAVTATLTPSAVVVAQRVDIPLGDSGGLFSNSTINPMVDLKRGVNQTAGVTAFTYTGRQRLYFRLATLDDFNGDTWSFSKRLSDAGDFYSGTAGGDADGRWQGEIQLGYSAFFSSRTPISRYLDILGDAATAEDIPLTDVRTTVTIQDLRSRFLPVPAGGVTASGMGKGWRQGGDAAIYSTSGGTETGMGYTAEGQYLAPIASVRDFRRITALTALERKAEQARQRQLITIRIIDDETVTDANGRVVGQVSQAGVRFSAAFIREHGLDARKARVLVATPVADDSTDGDVGETVQQYVIDTNPPSWMMRQARAYGTGAYADALPDDEFVMMTLSGSSGGTAYEDPYDWGSQAPQGYDALPSRLPDQVMAVVGKAASQGVPTHGRDADEQIAAMRYLVNHFTTGGFSYSLDAPDGSGRNNLDIIGDFLDRKTGYCAHYASALAVLGRAMGVKTRMVLGYSPGSGETSGGSIGVSSSQLHSWVEAYIDGLGWVPFDVTPASDDETTAAPSSTTSSDTTGGDDASAGARASTSTGSSAPGHASGTASSPADAGGSSTSAGAAGDDSPTDGGTTAAGSAMTRYGIRAAEILVLMLLAYGGVTAGMWARRLRRRRRYARIRAGDADAPRLAWRELTDTAWDHGIRWAPGATDADVVAAIMTALDGDDDDADDIVDIRRCIADVADQAVRLTFSKPVTDESSDGAGERSDAGESLVADLERIRQTFHAMCRKRYGGAAGVARRAAMTLLPPSLPHRRP